MINSWLCLFLPILSEGYEITHYKQASVVDRPATLHCSVNNLSRAVWKFSSSNTKDGEVLLANSDRILPDMGFEIQTNSGQYDLYTNRLKSTNAGTYYCAWLMLSEPVVSTIELVVLDDKPECNLISANFSQNEEYMQINCTMKYEGNWTPTIDWKLETRSGMQDFRARNETLIIQQNKYVTSLITVEANSLIRGLQLVCQTNITDQSNRISGFDGILRQCCLNLSQYNMKYFLENTASSRHFSSLVLFDDGGHVWIAITLTITGILVVAAIGTSLVILRKKSEGRVHVSPEASINEENRSSQKSFSDSSLVYGDIGGTGACGWTSQKRSEGSEHSQHSWKTSGDRASKSNSILSDSHMATDGYMLEGRINANDRRGTSTETMPRTNNHAKEHKCVGADGTVYEDLNQMGEGTSKSRTQKKPSSQFGQNNSGIYASIDHNCNSAPVERTRRNQSRDHT